MRGAGVLVVAALVLGACNGGEDGATDGTLPPSPETTVTTVPDYTVPAVIDVAYVEKVMAALDHVYGDAIRTLARERTITQDFLDRLAAIYGDRFFRLAQDSWVKDVASDLRDLQATPGDPRTDVTSVIRGDASCVVVAVTRDFSQTRAAPASAPSQHYIALVPMPDRRDPKNLNPTPWIMAYDGFTSSGNPPSEPCSGT